MKIVISPDPILREVCLPIEEVDNSIRRLAKQMAREMYKYDGCGIAAPQVGVTKRLVVIDVTYDGKKGSARNPMTLINPQLIDHSDQEWTDDEGCLSVPGISCPISRYKQVKVRYIDLDGAQQEVDASEDLLCRCLQHEMDHLDGLTMFERLDPILKIKALQQYKEALVGGAKPSSKREKLVQD